MNSYLLVYLTHRIPVMLLLLGVIVHVVMVWRARGKSSAILQEKLRRTRVISLPVFSLLAASLPITGVVLSSMAGWPLSDQWLMLSIILFPLVFVFGGLLYRSLTLWQAQLSDQPGVTSSQQGAALLWVGLLLAVLLMTSLLMMVKPL